jgi:hypothetical protein
MNMIKQKIAIIIASALMCLGFAFSPVIAVAEENAGIPLESNETVDNKEVVEETESVENLGVLEGVEGIVPESKGSKWFDKYVVPFLVEYGAVLAGFATGVVLFLKTIRKSKAAFAEATDIVNTSNNDNAELRAEIKKFKKDNEAWKKSIEKKVVEGLADTNTTVHKILDVQEIAYKSNTTLVGNGTAKKISEVIHK